MSVAPRLSVLLPTYNGKEFVEQALQSVWEQEAGDAVEVVAVDDGSTDGTLDLLERWQDRLPLQVHRREHVGNWVANTNVALSHARGTWISWLHQDDCWLPGRIRALFALADRMPDIDVFLHPAEFWDDRGRCLGCWRSPFSADRVLGREDILPKLILQNTIPIVSPMVKRSLLQEIGPMDEDLWFFADWDYWLKLGGIASWYYRPEPLAVFRLHSGSQTMQRTGRLAEIGRQFDVVTQRACGPADFPFPDRAKLARLLRFARATYLLMLSGFHDRSGAMGEFLRAAVRVGPRGWRHYLAASRLAERVWPRIRLLFSR